MEVPTHERDIFSRTAYRVFLDMRVCLRQTDDLTFKQVKVALAIDLVSRPGAWFWNMLFDVDPIQKCRVLNRKSALLREILRLVCLTIACRRLLVHRTMMFECLPSRSSATSRAFTAWHVHQLLATRFDRQIIVRLTLIESFGSFVPIECCREPPKLSISSTITHKKTLGSCASIFSILSNILLTSLLLSPKNFENKAAASISINRVASYCLLNRIASF